MTLKRLLITFLLFASPAAAQVNVARMNSGLNLQTCGPYTVQATDSLKLVVFNCASAVAVTLPPASTFGAGVVFQFKNLGSGSVTITPASGTIDNAATFVMTQGAGTDLYNDGANYQTQKGAGTGGGGGGGSANTIISFTNATSATASIGANTTNVVWACWDNGSPTANAIYPSNVLVSNATFTVQFTFVVAQSGYCVVNSSGGSMVWPSAPGVTQCAGTPCSSWGASLPLLGTDTNVPSAGVLTASQPVACTDSNGGLTTVGCSGGGGGGSVFPNINNEIWVDGTTYANSCSGLQAAINATTTIPNGSFGTVVHLPANPISCTTQVTFPTGVNFRQIILRGSGPGSEVINNFGTDALFLATGTLGASTTTTANAAAGALSVTVASSVSFTPPQWVEIASVNTDPAYYVCPSTPPAGGGGQCNSELVELENASGGVLTFKTSLSNAYTTGATITIVNPAVIQFENMSILNTGQNFPAIKFVYCIYCGATNVEIGGGLFTNATHPAIHIGFYHSTHSFVRGGLFGNFDGNLAGGTQSAAFVVGGASSHITFDWPHVYKYVENAIVEGSHDIVINGGDYHGCVDDCWNTHGDGNYNVTFNGGNYGGIAPNTSYNGYCIVLSQPTIRAGFPDRNISVNGINCHDYGSAGIAISGSTTPGAAISNVSISGGTVKNELKAGVGVLIEGCNTCTVQGVNIRDVFTGGTGILAEYSQNVTVTGNIGVQGNGATSTIGLSILQTQAGTFIGNILGGYTTGINVITNTSNSVVANNIAYGNTSNYNFDSTTTATRWNNLGDAFSANFYGDSPSHATFYGFSPTANASANTFSTNTFLKSIKVVSISAVAVTSPTCSTAPTFVVTDGTITSSALTVSGGYQTTALNTAFPANDAISIRQTNTPTCSTYPANINFNVEYTEVGN